MVSKSANIITWPWGEVEDVRSSCIPLDRYLILETTTCLFCDNLCDIRILWRDYASRMPLQTTFDTASNRTLGSLITLRGPIWL